MPKVITDEKLIDELLNRGVESVYPDKESLKKVLLSGKRIRLYCGFDPTAPALHIGNAINIRRMAKFQELGHEVIFLIGDFTAMIGDPTDKLAARKQLSRKEVLQNCKDYKRQASNLINFGGANPAKLMYNSKWNSKLKFADVLELASNFTVGQMLERDMFEKRISENKPVYLHEFMYPLIQGYDSVAMDVDLELGGNDQTFNMLAGRDLMKAMKNKEKFVLAGRLLADSTGKKVGKTEGNVINLTDSAENMFGKVMSWTDPMIKQSLEILTDVPLAEIEKIAKAMSDGANPRDYKLQLAYEVVKIYKDEKSAKEARENFIKVFSQKEKPSEVESYKVKSKKLVEILVETDLVESNSQAKRDIEAGGVKVDDQIIKDINFQLSSGEHLIQKGKRFFVKAIVG